MLESKKKKNAEVLEELFARIEERASGISNAGGESYTRHLLQEGKAKIARKVGEEAVEVVVAALAEGKENFLEESADLLYHWLVLCHAMKVSPAEVYQVLSARLVKK